MHVAAGVLSGFVSYRQRQLEAELRAAGVTDERVIAAVLTVPHELFVGRDGDKPVPGPCIVAARLDALRLRPIDRVLEIGTGSGYVTAILSLLVSRVVAVHMIPGRAEAARERLAAYGYARIHIVEMLPDPTQFDHVICD